MKSLYRSSKNCIFSETNEIPKCKNKIENYHSRYYQTLYNKKSGHISMLKLKNERKILGTHLSPKFKILRQVSSQPKLTIRKNSYEGLAANQEGKYKL